MFKIEYITQIILAIILVFLVVSIWAFMGARQEIAKINKSQIEHCYMLDCDVTPFGDVQCHSIGIEGNPGLIKINGSDTWVGTAGK